MQNNMNSVAPVNVGDVFETKIESVGDKGDGVCRKNGFVIFVPNVKKGDYVKVKVTKVLAKVGFGEAVEKIDKANDDKRIDLEALEDVREPEVEYEDTEDFGEE